MAKRLVVFNHKGGVSKTTSAYNLGWMMAREHRVLLVDADPRCNLTGLIFGDDFEKYYTEDTTKNQNIKDGVAAAFLGKPVPIQAVACLTPRRAETLFLLPGSRLSGIRLHSVARPAGRPGRARGQPDSL